MSQTRGFDPAYLNRLNPEQARQARKKYVYGGPAAKSAPLAIWFMWLGLFTLSWDRFANFSVGSFNVKLPVLAFAVSFGLILVDMLNNRSASMEGHKQAVVGWALAVPAVFIFSAMFAENRVSAILQLGTVILGSLTPFFAIYLNLRLHGRVEQTLTALIRGGYFAALFGVYQLAAFYAGLPQLVSYTAVGGGAGRISSFSYEAGYFGYFLILTMAAIIARDIARDRATSWLPLGFFLVVLLFVNSRATYLTLPVLAVLFVIYKPRTLRVGKLVPAAFFTVVAVGFALVFAQDEIVRALNWARTIFDPTEETSNAPRLNAYQEQLGIIADNPIIGVGPGNLVSAYVDARNLDVSKFANEVVANNIYLQAMLDGGVILLAVELGLIIAAIVTLFYRGAPAAKVLMMGWITVIAVGGLVTSYYFDVKLWAVLGLAAAIGQATSRSSPRSRS